MTDHPYPSQLDESHPPDTAVVVPHYNQLEFTKACCESLAKQNDVTFRILIVDNASTAHAPAELVEACPGAEVFRMEGNLGFAGGVNYGVREALKDSAIRYLWVLNNDTFCPPETLKLLQNALESSPRTGLAGCRMIEGKGTPEEKIVAAGKRLLHPWLIPINLKYGNTPDYLSGACLLIRRELFEDIGLFDEGYFFFFEDADFSLRAKQAGWDLAVCHEALIEHKGSATVRSLKEMQARCYRAGHVRLLRKVCHYPMLLSLPPFLFRILADSLTANLAAVRGNLKGIYTAHRHPLPTHVAGPIRYAPLLPPEIKQTTKILFASHQTGGELPGYLRYALECLSKAGYRTTLITTQTELDALSRRFLDDLGVELFPTENRGFDFGMWERYLKSIPPDERQSWSRILLINDSVVYFRDHFDHWIRQAEACPADAVSLSANTDYGYHLQSYFLYLKPAALPVFMDHLSEAKSVETYWDAVMRLEIGFSRKLQEAGLKIAPLYKTNRPFDFCYEALIKSGTGFIKRKLLEKRYTFGQTLNFLRNDRQALDCNYRECIQTQGQPDPAFDPDWLPAPNPAHLKQVYWRILYYGWSLIVTLTLFSLAIAPGVWVTQHTESVLGSVVLSIITGLSLYVILCKMRRSAHDKAVGS
jgi:GT2 family glycosyltransferase